MNYINCKNTLNPVDMRKSVAFWAQNTVEHIASLKKLPGSTSAVLYPDFTAELDSLSSSFKKISELYHSKEDSRLPAKPDFLFKENRKLINLLERMKFEGFGGYPYLQQSIFHYIYEQRYINAIFGITNTGQGLITIRFSGMGNYPFICMYNQMYFWSVIGAMHPSLLIGSEAFYRTASVRTRNFLTEITNRFNSVCYALSSLKKPIERQELAAVFKRFQKLNTEFLNFLSELKSGSGGELPQSFYETVNHMWQEHTLVKELNDTMAERLLRP